jgi:dihydropteroate synthase
MPAHRNSKHVFPVERFVLDCRGRRLDCTPGIEQGAHVMGILNVTPDSFSDGGLYVDLDAALKRVEVMLEEGAVLIDIGGESTRPRGSVYGEGAARVSADEERRRVVPVVEAIRQHFPEALVSIDTYKPEVARAALEAGAHLVNDVTGLRDGSETAAIAAGFGAPLIVMHSLGRPGEMPHEYRYEDVVEEVATSLGKSVRTAGAAGVRQAIVDPGFGFGKSAAENLRLVNSVDRFLQLHCPVLVGLSRKSTIGAVLGSRETPLPVERRLYGTLGATAVAVLRGATLVRTHDVRPTVELLRVLAATAASSIPSFRETT